VLQCLYDDKIDDNMVEGACMCVCMCGRSRMHVILMFYTQNDAMHQCVCVLACVCVYARMCHTKYVGFTTTITTHTHILYLHIMGIILYT